MFELQCQTESALLELYKYIKYYIALPDDNAFTSIMAW
jgi:hypothetical protein